MRADAIADEIVGDALEGVDGTGVRIGLIGEIGVSGDFTAEEEKSLRGAARAQAAHRPAAHGPSARLVPPWAARARPRRGRKAPICATPCSAT